MDKDNAPRQSDIDRVMADGVDSFHATLYFHMSQLLAEHADSFDLTWAPVENADIGGGPPYQAKFMFTVNGLLPYMTVSPREVILEKCAALETFVAAKARRFKRNKTAVTMVPGSAKPDFWGQRTPIQFEVLVRFE